jgi:hypothetical protein
MCDTEFKLMDLSEYESELTRKYIPLILDKFRSCNYNGVVDIEIPELAIQGLSTYRFSIMETANDYTLFVGFIKADGEEEYITTPYYEKDVLSPRISIREYIENLISLGVCLIFDESQDY